MNRKTTAVSKKHGFIIYLMLVLLLFLFSCSPTEEKISEERENFHFNAMTVLDDLSQGSIDYETLLEQGEADSDVPLEVHWHIQDFFTISRVVHQLAWGESLDGWNLNDVNFGLMCDASGNYPIPYMSTLRYFENDGDLRYVSEVSVRSINNQAWVKKTVYHPRIEEWSTMELDQIFFVEDIFQIAEKNWGEDIRKEVNNLCDVGIWYFPINGRRDKPYWRVGYDIYDADGEVIGPKVFFLDPFTGQEIK